MLRRTATIALAASARALALNSPMTGANRPALLLRGGQQAMMATLTQDPPISLSEVAVQPAAAALPEWSGDLLVLPCWEAESASEFSLSSDLAALDVAVGGILSDLVTDQEFKGAAGSKAVVALPKSGGASARRLAIVGMGKSDKAKVGSARKLGDALATLAKEQKAKSMGVALPAEEPMPTELLQACLEATLLGLSPDTRYKSDQNDEENKPPALASLDLLGADVDSGTVARARTIAAGVLVTKGLVASPPNYLTPTTMAGTAAALAAEFPTLTLKVLEEDECKALGMGAYLGVSQGACEPPKFIHLTYTPPAGVTAQKKVAIIGKGLTFDSGGYNIKAGAGSMIEKMKFDMGGAGAVLGAARSVAELAPPVETHFIVAACENMVSAEAMRPGDILTASNDKTIEILNTDAEGRLTLADALVYADRLGNVDTIVDIATLTGACIVALGPDYGAVYTDSDELLGRLMGSAEAGGEPLWRMPLAPEYVDQLKSPIADLKNLGAPGGGGSITAALFLREFIGVVSPDATWAHLDIAGPVWNDKAGGATGYGVRTLVGLVEGMGDE